MLSVDYLIHLRPILKKKNCSNFVVKGKFSISQAYMILGSVWLGVKYFQSKIIFMENKL